MNGDSESLRAQLALLQSRLTLYGARLWQVPLTYAGVVWGGLALSERPSDVVIANNIVPLTVFGVLVLLLLGGIIEGYRRTAWYLEATEHALKLTPTTRCRWLHFVPSTAIVVFGLLAPWL